MNTFDQKYLALLTQVRQGYLKPTRSGATALMVPGATFEHDMREGFPLTTLRKVKFDLIASELQFHLTGSTDKKWLQDRGNHIWDDWCDPAIIPYASDEDTKRKMRAERDLGPLYGFQWRHFGAPYQGYEKGYTGQGVDQIAVLLHTLKNNPESKRMVVTCWNPSDLGRQAIPPCPFAFSLSVFGDTLHLSFFQRSVDIMLGFPFDFASHALLLDLLAKEVGLKAGKVTAYFANVELYESHIPAADELLARTPAQNLPGITTETFISLLEWNCRDSHLTDYQPASPLKINIVV